MKNIIIKLSGECFSHHSFLKDLIGQIKELKKTNKIGIIVGAGNIFRGAQHGKALQMRATMAHCAGMVATIVNGLILQDLLEQVEVETELFSAIPCPEVCQTIQQSKIDRSLKKNRCLIFVGGTGNPFFSTDTNAILRALQIGATQVWKGTKVDGIYSDDPEKNKTKKLELYKKISYEKVIEKKLRIMDLTAITLAQDHKIKIRVFNLFEKNALLTAAKNKNFGSIISNDK
jgi:uridylate kinase